MADLRILIVGDNPLARTGLSALLAEQPGLTVVGQTGGGAELATLLEAYAPDILVWDLGWDVSLTLEQVAEAREAGPAIVALLPDETRAGEIWAAGVSGLLLRDTDADELAAALLAVGQGLAVFDPALAPAVLSSSGQPSSAPTETLTARELEVLQLMAEGLANKAIAQRLDISEHTVKFHVNAILGKLEAQSRTDAVVRASRMGLIVL